MDPCRQRLIWMPLKRRQSARAAASFAIPTRPRRVRTPRCRIRLREWAHQVAHLLGQQGYVTPCSVTVFGNVAIVLGSQTGARFVSCRACDEGWRLVAAIVTATPR